MPARQLSLEPARRISTRHTDEASLCIRSSVSTSTRVCNLHGPGSGADWHIRNPLAMLAHPSWPCVQAAEAVSKQRDANLREQRLKAELAAASSLLPSSSAPGQLPDLSAHGTDALRRGMEETMTALTGWMHSPAETWAPKLQHLALILATGKGVWSGWVNQSVFASTCTLAYQTTALQLHCT